MTDTGNNICKRHSGIEARMDNLEKTNTAQWKEINGMKKFIMGSLLLGFMTLLGIVTQLAITLAR